MAKGTIITRKGKKYKAVNNSKGDIFYTAEDSKNLVDKTNRLIGLHAIRIKSTAIRRKQKPYRVFIEQKGLF